METSRAEGQRSMKNKMKEKVGSEEEEDEEDNVGLGFGEADKQKSPSTLSSKKVSGGGGSTQPCCQVENCTTDMTDAKRYHRRHKVCEVHAKATAVVVAGLRQRFCQQCSRLGNPNSSSSMNYWSSTKLKGVAEDDWPDTMRVAAEAHTTLMGKDQIEKEHDAQLKANQLRMKRSIQNTLRKCLQQAFY